MVSWHPRSPSCPLPFCWSTAFWLERKSLVFGVDGLILLCKLVRCTIYTFSVFGVPLSLLKKKSCNVISETGKVFTWGRGNYGQLGRVASANQNSELQSHGPVAEGGCQEACFPAEVKVLSGATQVRPFNECSSDITQGMSQSVTKAVW